MVHALQEARRVLKEGGLLIDLRPISIDVPLLILTREGWKSAGKPDQSPDRVDDLAAHRAIRAVVQEGLFARVSQDYFNVSNYLDSLKELREAAEGCWNGDMIISEEIWRQARTLFRKGSGKRRVQLPFRKKISVYRKI